MDSTQKTKNTQQVGTSVPQLFASDLPAGLVVFLVALPLCLGVALASGAPLFAGVLAGIIGGIVVGSISGSHTSVSGPAAGLTAVLAAQIAALGSFQALLLAVLIAGIIQIVLGVFRAGSIAVFFPASVIKGLLAAIGVILVLKQIPHLFGHDTDAEGEMSFQQIDNENTFSELIDTIADLHPGAMVIGLICLALLVLWSKSKRLQKLPIPAPLVVVLLGVALNLVLRQYGGRWLIEATHLVQVPVAENLTDFLGFLQLPDFSAAANPMVYRAAITIAIVASLETLLNLEAVDKLDPQKRVSPTNRELIAQGVGNVTAGLIGALPVTSVIVRSSVNIASGGKSKMATVVHGFLLLSFVLLFPTWLNQIPLSCLAAVLIMIGFKLAKPALFRQMWREGPNQFLPFLLTVLAIVFTDLLTGILIGLGFSILFILRSNLRRPIYQINEKHIGGDVLRIELANQVSFLNRAGLTKVFDSVPRGGHLLIDARRTDYIDSDVQDLIWEYVHEVAPARGVEVSMMGLKEQYQQLQDRVQYFDYTTRELQDMLTPDKVLQILEEGNVRFRRGEQLTRDLTRQLKATAQVQHPMAIVLSGASSRTPIEMIFDVGLGELYCARLIANFVSRGVLGSLEHATVVAGAKLIVVMGHSNSAACRMAIESHLKQRKVVDATGCENLDSAITEIQQSLDDKAAADFETMDAAAQQTVVDQLYRDHIQRTIKYIRDGSTMLSKYARQGKIKIVGAMYNVHNGEVSFFE
jgi:carbonic anhydrase